MTGVTAVPRPAGQRTPRRPSAGRSDAAVASHGRRGLRRAGVSAVVVAVLALIGTGAYVALQSVYFIGTNSRGLVTLYRGVPFQLPGNVTLFSSDYVSGVSASSLTPQRRRTMLDHSLRSESNAASLIRSLELGQLE
jgi:protein phosphatase